MSSGDLYAPIQGPITTVFGWSDDEINWLSNGNNLAVVLSSPLWAWLADTKGIRPTAQLAATVYLLAMACNLALLPEGLVPHRAANSRGPGGPVCRRQDPFAPRRGPLGP